MSAPEVKYSFAKSLAIILLVGSLIGILASFTLTYDKIQVLTNHNYKPSCNINPVLSCGSVMKTKQAELLGVPNTIFGLVSYSITATLGVLLLAKTKLERWIWIGLQLGVTLGFGFIHYLFFEGVFRIHAICPFCFMIWMITAPIFWYTTVYNLRAGNISFGKRFKGAQSFVVHHHGDFLGAWYVIIFGILLKQFWYYWKTLI